MLQFFKDVKRTIGVFIRLVKTLMAMREVYGDSIFKRVKDPSYRVYVEDLDGKGHVYDFFDFCEFLYDNGLYWSKKE